MTYIHSDQFRCAIIRGKAQAELDNLLPYYASIISEICPTSKENFDAFFNEKLTSLLGKQTTKKTLDNHRTEIAYKLFAMYYITTENIVHISERTLRLLEDNDQPAFFKDLCFKMQFPSGMNAKHTVLEQIKNNINIRQLCFVMAVLKKCDFLNLFLNVRQIGYYILNSKSVLARKASVDEVVEQIQIDLNGEISREIPNPDNYYYSYLYQHIKEQMTLLQLANIVTLTEEKTYKINTSESGFIEYMASYSEIEPEFNFYSLKENFDEKAYYKVKVLWDIFISKVSMIPTNILNSNVSNILLKTIPHISNEDKRTYENTKDLGDAGELFVLEYEKDILKPHNLENKVKNKAYLRGIGFDIESFSHTENIEKYIEVKATRRTTPMPIEFSDDVINLTKNEWIAAEKHQNNFFIYRVIFHNNGIQLFCIRNPFEHYSNGKISVIPLIYRLSFSNNSGSFKNV